MTLPSNGSTSSTYRSPSASADFPSASRRWWPSHCVWGSVRISSSSTSRSPASTRWPGRRLLEALLATVAEHGTTVFLSSHIISELEPVCDDLIILSSSNVRLSGSIEVSVGRAPRAGRPSTRGTTIGRRDRLCPPRRATIDAPGPRPPGGDRSGLADSRTRPRRDRPRLPRWAARRLLGPDQARRCLVIWLVCPALSGADGDHRRRARRIGRLDDPPWPRLGRDRVELRLHTWHVRLQHPEGTLLAFRSGDRDQFPAAPRPLPAWASFLVPPWSPANSNTPPTAWPGPRGSPGPSG